MDIAACLTGQPTLYIYNCTVAENDMRLIHLPSCCHTFHTFHCSLFCFTVIDAWGKPGSGIFQLNLKWLGDFDECQDVQSASDNHNVTLPDHLNFQGQYCTVGSPSNAGLTLMPGGERQKSRVNRFIVVFAYGCVEGSWEGASWAYLVNMVFIMGAEE